MEKVKRCAEISRGFSARIEEMRKTSYKLHFLFEELATSKVMAEERCEKFEKEKGDLAIENLRLKKEAEMWMETNEELKKLVEAEKARVLELECQIEIEEGLRVRAEVDFEASENRFKELVLGISMLDKRSIMLMNGAGFDSCGVERVVPTIGLMKAVGTRNANAIDLTEEADGIQVQPDSIRLNPAANLNGSSSHTPHTRDETESKEPVAKPAAPINKKEATHDIRGSGSVIHILSDSDDDTSQLSLRLKRKRVRSMSKENSFKNEPLDDKYIVVGLPKLGASATAYPRHSKRSINPPAKLARLH